MIPLLRNLLPAKFSAARAYGAFSGVHFFHVQKIIFFHKPSVESTVRGIICTPLIAFNHRIEKCQTTSFSTERPLADPAEEQILIVTIAIKLR